MKKRRSSWYINFCTKSITEKENVAMEYKYYLGMDAHSTKSTFALMNKRGKVLKRLEVKTTESDILKKIKG
jgi:activator of 2-hydroxyglutaryl-CoA dehydratase